MVNIEDFIKRIEIILDYYGLNASTFADRIGVQRSSLSHLLSGRNKPSLDFVLKILEVFPEVDLYWFLNGKGNFPKQENLEVSTKPSSPTPIGMQSEKFNNTLDLFSEESNSEKAVVDNSILNTPEISVPNTISNNDSEIERIVIFFKNGSFKSYLSGQ